MGCLLRRQLVILPPVCVAQRILLRSDGKAFVAMGVGDRQRPGENGLHKKNERQDSRQASRRFREESPPVCWLVSIRLHFSARALRIPVVTMCLPPAPETGEQGVKHAPP
jgi:hypothetical protein